MDIAAAPALPRRRALALGGVTAAAGMIGMARAADTDTALPIAQMEKILGASARTSKGVTSFGIDRTDVKASLPHGIAVKPAELLNGTFYFQSLGQDRAMMNADFGLKSEETNKFIDALVSGGITVQAFHQHLFDLSPMMWFVHFRMEGHPLAIAKAVRKAMGVTAVRLPQHASPHPKSPLDHRKLAKIIGGSAHVGGDGVVKIDVDRAEQIHLGGVAIKPGLGVATNIAFQPLDAHGNRALAIPDFAMLAGEVDAVFREMSKQGFVNGCLYNQETDEQPQLYFSHQWAVGNPEDLASKIRKGLDHTNSKFER